MTVVCHYYLRPSHSGAIWCLLCVSVWGHVVATSCGMATGMSAGVLQADVVYVGVLHRFSGVCGQRRDAFKERRAAVALHSSLHL